MCGAPPPTDTSRVLLNFRREARHALLFGEAVLRLRERVPGLRLLLPTLPPLRAAVAAAASGWTIPFELADGADAANRCAFCCILHNLIASALHF